MEKNNIVFIGTHCSGKSTMVKEISHTYPLIPVVKSVTRDLKEKGFPINDSEAKNYNLTQIICGNRDFENVLMNKNSFFDRTLLDTLVYSDYLYSIGKLDEWIVAMQVKLFEQVKDEFSIYFWLQPDFPLKGDGVRSEDEGFRNTIHNNFAKWIKFFELNVVKVSGSEEYRYSEVNKHIYRFLAQSPV